ncbi:ABC transporter permease [Chitinophaga silvatica]|uniref:ABC transporter permease n=1 Tax=Chitinophaga silvatica TaxID=2282649 RepID=A0A3E1YCS9_9BACT|nr:ABC transporter permease [Chitinophaga silvatica]RFS24055.1 ABC transporter permease [Chitinophaga silvatica]
MLISYLKIAWRNLVKQKVFALVNLLGMSAALCAVLLLSLTAYREWSFDQFHENKNSVYQIVNEKYLNGGDKPTITKSVAEPLAAAVKSEIPGIRHTTFIIAFDLPIRYGNNSYYLNTKLANTDFWEMFSFPMIKGSPKPKNGALNEVVITQKAATKLFGSSDAIGKAIEINIRGRWVPYTVGAIAENVPANSSIRFELVAPLESDPDYADIKGKWDVSTNPLFVQLEPGITRETFEKQLNILREKHYTKQDEFGSAKFRFKSVALKDFKLSEESYFFAGVNKYYPWLMLILSVLIISIACINFVNLSVAKSLGRSAEIGLRKSLGAINSQLFIQFWMESFLLCAIALIIGVMLAIGILPYYNRQFSQQLNWGMLQNIRLVAGIVIVFFLITLLAGGFPAWKIARQHIITVLKGKMTLNKGNHTRNSLIIVQFVVAVLLFSSTAIIWQQLNYIRKKDLGYNINTVISIPLDNATPAIIDKMKQELAQLSEVKDVSAGMNNFGIGTDGSSGNWIVGFSFQDRQVSTKFQKVDYNYARTMGMNFIAGRDFSRAFGTDSSAVLINEAMARQLGVKEPIGTSFEFSDMGQVHVVGVVKDYNFESLRQKIDPLTMAIAKPQDLSYMFASVTTANLSATLDKITKEWKEVNPLSENPPSYLNDNIRRLYEEEGRFSNMLMSGALLAIIITCMGLFAVTVLTIAQRKKEISIRKVLGASVQSVVMLLTKDFLMLVLIAIVIATPFSWYFMHQWLQQFEFHITIRWWIFMVVGFVAVAFAILTVCLQSIHAAMANPVKSLNRE